MKKVIPILIEVFIALAAYFYDFQTRCIDPGFGGNCDSSNYKFYGLFIGYLVAICIAKLALKILHKNYYVILTFVFLTLYIAFILLNSWLRRF